VCQQTFNQSPLNFSAKDKKNVREATVKDQKTCAFLELVSGHY
jgi:hypothetical protein